MLASQTKFPRRRLKIQENSDHLIIMLSLQLLFTQRDKKDSSVLNKNIRYETLYKIKWVELKTHRLLNIAQINLPLSLSFLSLNGMVIIHTV